MIFSVILNEIELATCRLFGNLRSMTSRSHNVNDVQMGKNDPLLIDEIGIIGEYAFCKYWNIFFDVSMNPRSGGRDCLLNNKRFDIKSTTYKNGKLIRTLKENEDVDYYALAIVDKNIVIFPGYASKNQLCQSKNVKDLGYGNSYVMEQSELTPWRDK